MEEIRKKEKLRNVGGQKESHIDVERRKQRNNERKGQKKEDKERN